LEGLRKFLDTSAGKVAAIVLAVGAVGLMVYMVRASLGPTEAEAASRDRLFICSETGKTFTHEVKVGESMPVHSPHSGKDTGYQAELCYWTADGKPKDTPTPVLLNERMGNPGPTFCPDCKRLVVGHNPGAQAGRRPPPVEAEYQQARKDNRNER
jgi:hypothetical protein